MVNGPQPIRAIPPSEQDDGIGRTRTPQHITTFKAFYNNLNKGAHGNYKLELGIPSNQKDLVWPLSDHDGKMLEITVTVLKRVKNAEE